jgi:ABC-type nitrate/sulfonate/bicarbonate transport system ATPase subunit
MIRLQQVSFAYPGSPLLFSSFDWEVESGSAWAVLGPSGCGKTSLLYLLAGLNRAAGGSVLIEGKPLDRPRPQTGLVLQDYGLLPWATVLENISLGLDVRRLYGPDGLHAPALPTDAPDIAFWIDRLGLSGLERKYPGALSGGQRQRVAIARTLVLQPDLLLMDEPFSSLDAPTRFGLEELTLQLWQEKRFTFIVVTHAIEEAVFLGQRILVLNQPPICQPKVFANPVFGQPAERDSRAYQQLCAELRASLEAK